MVLSITMIKLACMNVFMEWSHTLGPNDMHLAVVFIEVFGVYFGYTVMRPLLNFQ